MEYTKLYTPIVYIYALININEPDIIRYVGKTNNPKRRVKEHIKEKYGYKGNWIKSFDAKNLLGMKILAICPEEEFPFFDAKFIKEFKSDKLTNSDDNGSGNQNRKREIIENASKKTSKQVYQFDLNGNYITEYKSAREAGRKLKISHSYIVRSCNGEFKHTQGFIFSYDKNKVIESISTPNAVKKQVAEIDSNGNIIGKWKSLMECSRNTGIDNGNLSRVCNGKLKNIKGRYFIFV